MKTAAAWFRGALVGSAFAVTATGAPAEKTSLAAQAEPVPVTLDPLALPPLEVEVPAPTDPFPGHTYGNLEDVACLVSLESRGIAYERYGRHAHGVQTPVRLMGLLHGVRFLHAEATDWLSSARHEILDCRLALALDDSPPCSRAAGWRPCVTTGFTAATFHSRRTAARCITSPRSRSTWRASRKRTGRSSR